MDHCDQVSVQEKEDNFLMQENMFCKGRYFSVMDEISPASLCWSVRSQALKQLNCEVKELLTLKTISHYRATILESCSRRCIFKRMHLKKNSGVAQGVIG